MFVGSIVPCSSQHRVCEACAIQYGSKCPVCLKRYRRERKPCRITNAVAAVVFPDRQNVGTLTVPQLDAYRKRLVVEACRQNAHMTRDAETYLSNLKEHVASVASVTRLVRCLCSHPGLEGGFVAIPTPLSGGSGRMYVGCPCWRGKASSNGCGFFRWIKK